MQMNIIKKRKVSVTMIGNFYYYYSYLPSSIYYSSTTNHHTITNKSIFQYISITKPSLLLPSQQQKQRETLHNNNCHC